MDDPGQAKIKDVLTEVFRDSGKCDNIAEQVGFRTAVNVVGMKLVERGVLDDFNRMTIEDMGVED